MDASGPATRRRVANEALNSSVRTRSMTSSNLASLAELPKARRPPPSRDQQQQQQHQQRRGPSARPVDGSRIARRLGRGAVAPTAIPGPSPVKPTFSTGLGPSLERRMPLLPKSPEQQGLARTANPFDLTSPGKRATMVFRSPERPRPPVLADGPTSDDQTTSGPQRPQPGFGAATPMSASKRPRSPSPVFSSSPQRPFRPLGSSVRPGSFLHPPSVGRLPSSSPLADRTYDGDLTPRTKKARYEDATDPDPEAMDVDEPASSFHRFRPPSSEGPDIGSLDLASPSRFREPRPLIFGGMMTPSRPIFVPPTIRTTSAAEDDTTTPPGSPPAPRSPFRVPRPLGSVFGTVIISPRRVSPIKEATMPTDIPLRSPSPDRPALSPTLDMMMNEDDDDMPSSKFLGTGIFSALASGHASSSSTAVALPPLSRSTAGMNSLESIEEERSPIKPRPDGSFPRPPSSASSVAGAAMLNSAAKNPTLKSKYRGLAGATIPRPPPAPAGPAIAPVASNTRSGLATTFRAAGIPRAGSVGAGLSSTATAPPPPTSTSSMPGAGVGGPSRAQDTNDRLAKLQAMLDKMSSGRRPSLNPPPAVPLGPPSAASTGMGRIGHGMPSSSSSIALASSASSGEGVVTRRRSSSSGSTTKPPPTSQVFSRSGAPLGPSTAAGGGGNLLKSSTSGPRRASQILPSSTTFARLDASTGREVEVKPKEGPLKEVVAFVDVRTAEGDDAGQVFVEMLKGLGAKVVTRPTCPLTHIVFKGGKPGTIDRWCAHAEPKPILVGIGWVVRCREVMAKAVETPYVVEVTKEAVQGKRRRTMEPKALALANAGLSMSTSGLAPPGRPSVAASIEQAKRKSLQFAPKVGSPLARRMFDASSLLHALSDDD